MPEKFASQIVKKTLADYPNYPTRRIARILMDSHPLLFKDYETARSSVRYHRGSNGNKNRSTRELKTNITPEYRIPESYAKQKTPFIMDGVSRIGILSDIHIPYHTVEALECAIARAKKENVDGIILNGDTIDCHMLSHFDKDPDARNFKQEREITKQFLSYLRNKFPKARIVWKDGNHEERFHRYMIHKAPEIFDTDFFSLDILLGLENYGIEYVTGKRIIMAGMLPVMHGHEFNRGITPPVNPARGAYLKAKQSVIVGHHHKTSEHTETSMDGTITTTWSVGCLSDLHPDYNPYNSYNHGAAIIFLEKDHYEVHNYRIVNGRALN